MLENLQRRMFGGYQRASEAPGNFTPAPDPWSCGAGMEHIAAAEDLYAATVKEKIMDGAGGRG